MPALIGQYLSNFNLQNVTAWLATDPTAPTGRLWRETNRLLGLFEYYRDGDDNANAAPCFGGLARYRFAELISRPGYDASNQSVISAFQPKSGGTFLHNRLLQLGYQEFWWMFPHRRCHTVCYASDDALDYFLRGGCACHTHARPEPNILAALDRAKVRKIWVHLRNPAESVVSAYYHYLGEGHGKGELGEQRKQEALLEAQRQGLAPETSLSEFVVHKLGWYVDWVTEWLGFAQRQPGVVVFSYHGELADTPRMLGRVFRKLRVKLKGRVSAEVLAEDRFRQKASNDWRQDLTADARRYVEQRVRADLMGFPEFDELWT